MKVLLLLIVISLAASLAKAQKYKTNNEAKYDFESASRIIDSLHTLLSVNPERFEELAQDFSQDPGSFNNDGYLPMKMKLEGFEEVFRYHIERLDVGKISKPFETWFGWHIARVLAITKDEKYEIQHILIQYE